VRGFCDLAAEQTFCGANNVREPLIAWTPTIAPSGMEYYEKDLVPQWKNTLLFTTLKDKRLMQYTIGSNTTKEFLVDKYGRLRDLAISPEGKLYICTDNGNNQDVIVEIGPSGN
jgi:glucose/arabinose dehydrogenase